MRRTVVILVGLAIAIGVVFPGFIFLIASSRPPGHGFTRPEGFSRIYDYIFAGSVYVGLGWFIRLLGWKVSLKELLAFIAYCAVSLSYAMWLVSHMT